MGAVRTACTVLADGHIDGDNIICGVHNWDFRFDIGVSEYNNEEALHLFPSKVVAGRVVIQRADFKAFLAKHPPAVQRDSYQGAYQASASDAAGHTLI